MTEPPKEIKKKYMELQMMQHQMQQIQQQVQALEAQATEMEAVQQTLGEFSRSKAGSDSFVTLTPGLFVKATVEETDVVYLNVGGGVVVQKKVPDAMNVIAAQGTEMRKLEKELTEQMNKLVQHAEKIQKELRKLIT